jgi:hypothetical protein
MMSDCDKQEKAHSADLSPESQSINPLSSWAPAPASAAAAAAATVASSSNLMLKIAVTTFNHCNKKRDIVRVAMTSDWSSWSSWLQQAHDLKLSMIVSEWSTSILSRKSHVENRYPFNQYYNENKNKRENITSIGTRTEGGEIEALQAHNLVQFSQQILMLKIATNEDRLKLFKLIILLNSLEKISCWK